MRPVGGASHARDVFVAAERGDDPSSASAARRRRPSPSPSIRARRARRRVARTPPGVSTRRRRARRRPRRRGGRPCSLRRAPSIWTPSMVCVPVRYTRGVDGAGDVGRDDVRGFGRSLVRRARGRPRRRRGCRARGRARRRPGCARRGGGGGRHGAILGRGDAKGKSNDGRDARRTRLHGGPRQASPSEREAETRARAVVRALGGARDEIRAVFEDAHRRVAVSAAPRLSRVAHHVRAQSLGIARPGRGRRSRPRPSRARARATSREARRAAHAARRRGHRARGCEERRLAGCRRERKVLPSSELFSRRIDFFGPPSARVPLVPSRPSTASSSLSSPPRGPYPPARYTFIHADLRRHRGHLSILAAHTSQHTRCPHSR